MKLVVAIVRPEKPNDVLEALFQAEVQGLTISRVQGHGGETEQVETYRGTTVKMELSEKVRLEIGVSDHFVEPTVKAILTRPARATSATARSSCCRSRRSTASAPARRIGPPSRPSRWWRRARPDRRPSPPTPRPLLGHAARGRARGRIRKARAVSRFARSAAAAHVLLNLAVDDGCELLRDADAAPEARLAGLVAPGVHEGGLRRPAHGTAPRDARRRDARQLPLGERADRERPFERDPRPARRQPGAVGRADAGGPGPRPRAGERAGTASRSRAARAGTARHARARAGARRPHPGDAADGAPVGGRVADLRGPGAAGRAARGPDAALLDRRADPRAGAADSEAGHRAQRPGRPRPPGWRKPRSSPSGSSARA